MEDGKKPVQSTSKWQHCGISILFNAPPCSSCLLSPNSPLPSERLQVDRHFTGERQMAGIEAFDLIH